MVISFEGLAAGHTLHIALPPVLHLVTSLLVGSLHEPHTCGASIPVTDRGNLLCQMIIFTSTCFPGEIGLALHVVTPVSVSNVLVAFLPNVPNVADGCRLSKRRMLCCGALGAAFRAGNDRLCVVGIVAICESWLSSNT